MKRLCTRRTFVTMLSAAAVAATLPKPEPDERPPDRWAGTTRWIGHC